MLEICKRIGVKVALLVSRESWMRTMVSIAISIADSRKNALKEVHHFPDHHLGP